jgi:protein-disulfide isomerase
VLIRWSNSPPSACPPTTWGWHRPRGGTTVARAEAAGAQGKFWETHDYLFALQQALDEPDLIRDAGDLGLDVDRFARGLSEQVHAARVRDDVAGGLQSGVGQTPTLFLNGVRQRGVFTVPALTDSFEVLSRTRRDA